jgi:hypothetical protein
MHAIMSCPNETLRYVAKLKYLEMTVADENNIHDGTKQRIGNICDHLNHSLMWM